MEDKKIKPRHVIACICAVATGLNLVYPLAGRSMTEWEALVIFAIITMCMFAGGIALAAEDIEDGRVRRRTVYVRPEDLKLDRQGRKCVNVWARKATFLPFVPVRAIRIDVPAPEAYDAVRLAGKPMELCTEYVRKQALFVVTDQYTRIWDPDDRYGTQ